MHRRTLAAAFVLVAVSLPAQDHAAHMAASATSRMPTEVGQDAYAAIAEIVAILTKDPATDWTTVDVEALRQHLRDMQLVTLRSVVDGRSIPGGAEYVVRGDDEVVAAARRMTMAHAAATLEELPVRVTVTPEADRVLVRILAATPSDELAVARVRGLGFIGWIASGGHHQAHHLAIARGQAVHRH
jgi:hypothetical protein